MGSRATPNGALSTAGLVVAICTPNGATTQRARGFQSRTWRRGATATYTDSWGCVTATLMRRCRCALPLYRPKSDWLSWVFPKQLGCLLKCPLLHARGGPRSSDAPPGCLGQRALRGWLEA